MKRCVILCALLTLSAVLAYSDEKGANYDSYKPVLDRLESLTQFPLPGWRLHADLPHPEDVALDDTGWEVVQLDAKWTGPRVLRRWIEIPEKINGYAVRGTRVKLDLRFDFPWNNTGPVSITVFANGSLISRGDEDMQQPIPLTENAQPGQRFLIAARVVSENAETTLEHAELTIEPASGHPDPALLRTEILAAL